MSRLSSYNNNIFIPSLQYCYQLPSLHAGHLTFTLNYFKRIYVMEMHSRLHKSILYIGYLLILRNNIAKLFYFLNLFKFFCLRECMNSM